MNGTMIMKKLIFAILAAAALAFSPIQSTAHAGGWGYHGGGGWGYHGGWGYGYRGWGYPAFGFGVASGFALGAAVSSPWYYNGYYYPYGGYYNYYTPSYYYSSPSYQPAPAASQPAAPAPTQQPTTVINNYYYNSSPMSSANAMFGR